MISTTPRHVRFFAPLAFTALGAGIALIAAGPLNPPAGPVAPSNKTLAEIEPRIAVSATNTPGDADSLFKITAPGSYYLTANITGVAGKHGIEIASSGVTLDLNGFELLGAPGSLDGVTASEPLLRSIRLINGSVRGWGASGVSLGDSGYEGIDLTNLRVSDCSGEYAIRVYRGSVTNCIATMNSGTGISASEGSRIISCSSSKNGDRGISTNWGVLISQCVAHDNSGIGISTIGDGTIVDCVASTNDGYGFDVGVRSTVSGCAATGNLGTGIRAGTACVLDRCTASNTRLGDPGSGSGFVAGGSAVISNCVAYLNAGTGIRLSFDGRVFNCTVNNNNGAGIEVGAGSEVAGCVVRFSSSLGIVADDDCTISGCTVSENGLSGIRVDADCHVFDNTCNDNGLTGTSAAGIQTTAANNRVEGNVCSNNQMGFEALTGSTGNLFIRNSASSNAVVNYSFVANNRYGVIVDITAATAAVNGNTATSTMTTTDPHANFRY